MPSYGRRKTDKVEIKPWSSIRARRVLFYRILFVIDAVGSGSSLAQINRCLTFSIETKAKVRYPLRGVLTTRAIRSRAQGDVKTAKNIAKLVLLWVWRFISSLSLLTGVGNFETVASSEGPEVGGGRLRFPRVAVRYLDRRASSRPYLSTPSIAFV